MKLQEANRPVLLSDVIELAQAIHIELDKKKSKKGDSQVPQPNKQLTKKQRLYAESQICALCKIPFISISEATIDHIIPKSKGGSNDMRNLQLAHFKCNNEKGDKIL